jgi:hypothetical protein
MGYITTATFVIVPVVSTIVGGYVWKWYYGKRNMAIRAATLIVNEVSTEMIDGIEMTVDEVTCVVGDDVIDSIDITAKKRRRPRAKAPFRSWLVKVGKAKFGTPRRTEGNRMCVRKYLYDQCVEHGVLARHIWENVDIATEMVFVYTEFEVECAAIKHVQSVKENQALVASLGGTSQGAA